MYNLDNHASIKTEMLTYLLKHVLLISNLGLQ